MTQEYHDEYDDHVWDIPPNVDVSPWPQIKKYQTKRGLFLTITHKESRTSYYATRILGSGEAGHPRWMPWDGYVPKDLVEVSFFPQDFSDEEMERAEDLLRSL